MNKMMLILVAWMGFFANLQADWLDEVKAIHAEVRALTSNAEGLGDEQRLERFYALSSDLAMMESPGFAT